MSKSAIQWTEETWNPVAGCTIVSPECKKCYAMKMAHRLEAMGQAKYAGLTKIVTTKLNGKEIKNVVWNGILRVDQNALEIPHRRKKPTLFFVNSMSDMFHESLSHDDICSMWSPMVVVDRHRYQVLTKRAERMKQFVNSWIHHMRAGSLRPVENIWLGVSIGHHDYKERIDHLRDTIAAVRFLSCEPLLEDLGELNLKGIHWVIVGGESGHGARPMSIKWARNIRRQCAEQGVKFFMKQIGGQSGKRAEMGDFPLDLQIREYPVVA